MGKHWDGMQELKAKLDEMVPSEQYSTRERPTKKRPKPYAAESGNGKMPCWYGSKPGHHPMLPLKPPTGQR